MLALMAAALSASAACPPVAGDRILAGELARQVEAFAALDPATEIALAPAPGSLRTMSAAELHRLALRHGVRLEERARACFSRRAAPLDRERLEAALRKALPDPKASLELLEYWRGPVPDGELEFTPGGLGAPQPGGAMLWRGRVRYGAGRSAPVWARVRITVAGRRVVAARQLAARKVIEPGDLRMEEFRGPPGVGSGCARIEEAAGRMLRRALAAGQPVDPRMLAEPQDVERGSMVEVEVRAGTARLDFRAKAESGGRTGGWIVVRNPESGKRFRARIQGQGSVVVETEGHGRENGGTHAGRRADGAVSGVGGEAESGQGDLSRSLHPGGPVGGGLGR